MNMIEGLLERRETGDQGTFGRMFAAEKSYYTVELPWRENRQRMSCVPWAEWNTEHGFCLPEGEYHCEIRYSGHLGLTYWLKDVPGRTYCLIHPASYGGDVTKGWKTHLEGCIGLGFAIGWIEKQKAILRSRVAVVDFMNVMKREPFLLRIVNSF